MTINAKKDIKMIFKKTQSEEERLKNVLISDKQFSPEKVKKILKSDVFELLSNYCNLAPENLSVNVEIMSDGAYKFCIVATCDRLKIFGSLPDIY